MVLRVETSQEIAAAVREGQELGLSIYLLPGQNLTFLTTSGTLSAYAGVTNGTGDMAVTLSGTPLSVVSASFGGYISPQGWAYQPTMARATFLAWPGRAYR